MPKSELWIWNPFGSKWQLCVESVYTFDWCDYMLIKTIKGYKAFRPKWTANARINFPFQGSLKNWPDENRGGREKSDESWQKSGKRQLILLRCGPGFNNMWTQQRFDRFYKNDSIGRTCQMSGSSRPASLGRYVHQLFYRAVHSITAMLATGNLFCRCWMGSGRGGIVGHRQPKMFHQIPFNS